jgi:hypothetical protein
MTPNLHQRVVDLIHQATGIMDELMREKIDLPTYARRLKALDANGLLDAHQEAFKREAGLVPYLDALMMISSLQHELDFQVAEYGASVASEDIKMLRELLPKLTDNRT